MTQEIGDMQALEERYAHTTQVTRAVLGHDPRSTQFQKVPGFWFAREYFVHCQQRLIRLHLWSEVTHLLDCTRRLRSASREHALPVCP